MRRILAFALFAALAVPLSAAKADPTFNIQIGSTSLNPGGSGYIDVMITADTPDATLDLYSYAFSFLIEPVGQTHTLSFSNPQGRDYLSNPLLNYVFLGSSAAFGNDGFPPTNPFGDLYAGPIKNPVSGPYDGYRGGDLSSTSDNIALTSGTAYLLVRLDITATLGSLPEPGDVFNISLVAADTLFQNFTLDADNGFVFHDIAFGSNVGQVTINSLSVPEPATITLIAIGLPFGGVFLRRRKAKLEASA